MKAREVQSQGLDTEDFLKVVQTHMTFSNKTYT